MGIKRRKGSIQKAKKPILINSLKLIINAIDQQNKQEIKKFRDRSIILIGFSGGFRRNEIVSLDYDDLDFVPEGLKINIKRSKTDQFGEGFTKLYPTLIALNIAPCIIKKLDRYIKNNLRSCI